MAQCYHSDIVFEDPAFGKLRGERAKNMWRMLCTAMDKNKDQITFVNVICETDTCSATWEAHYTFSKTGKRVHNCITATFEFKDGLIIKHTDTFNLHRWAKQALGFKGFMLGATNFFKKKLQRQTNKLLDKFEADLPHE